METLAIRLSYGGRRIEATRILGDSVTRRTEAHGPLHPLTLRSEMWLGEMLAVSGEPDEAADLFFHVVNTNAESSRSESVEHFEIMLWLGASLAMAGSNDVSQIFLTRAISEFSSRLGPEHIATVRGAAWLARAHAQKGDYPRALELRRQVLGICRRRFGPDHEATLCALVDPRVLDPCDWGRRRGRRPLARIRGGEVPIGQRLRRRNPLGQRSSVFNPVSPSGMTDLGSLAFHQLLHERDVADQMLVPDEALPDVLTRPPTQRDYRNRVREQRREHSTELLEVGWIVQQKTRAWCHLLGDPADG